MAESDLDAPPTLRAPAPPSATVAVRDLHIVYRVFGARQVRPGSAQAQGNALSRILNKNRKGITQVHAIRGVTFTAHRGESIGIVGTNGSGKSTLLRAIAGTLPPERGVVLSKSRPTLLGVNAALVPQLTGARNVEIGCLALGMSRDEIRERFDEIVDFSGIGEFIDLPMTAYSSGMAARLRFAIASSVPHEILLIDEALATGDVHFRSRSEQRILALREEASTVFLVSHEIGSVLETCNRGIWLDRGQIRMDGPVAEVAEAYESAARSGGTKAAQAVTSMAGAGVIIDKSVVGGEPSQSRGADADDHGPAAGDPAGSAPTEPVAGATSGQDRALTRDRRLSTRLLAPVTALISLAVFVAGSWQPAYWPDEAVTLSAVRRSWPDLFRLLNGDPSLVPYYLLMKPFAAVTEAEVWLRLPGELAAAAAVTLLVIALNSLLGTRVAVTAGCVLLAIPTVSLYAQMIRPYAFVMVLVLGCAIAWWKSLDSTRRWWSVAFGLLYIGIGTMHMYALTVAIPFAVAAWFVPVGARRSCLVRTLLPMGAAAVILSPYIAQVALRAPGPGTYGEFTPTGIALTLSRAVGSPWLAAALVLLAILGLFRPANSTADWKRLRVLTAVTAFGLPPLLILIQAVGMPTLVPRYYLFTIPALATLAGLGLVELGKRWWPVIVIGLIVIALLGMRGQVEYRSVNGHKGFAAREVAAAVQVPALTGLPVVANPPTLILHDLAAYAPTVVAERMPLSNSPDSTGRILVHRPPNSATAARRLAGSPAAIVLTDPGNDRSKARADVTAELAGNGFTQPWVTCTNVDRSLQLQVLARPDRTGQLSPQTAIADQVRAVAPSLNCSAG